MRSDLTSQFAELAPWVFQFRIGDQNYGGGITVAGDPRVDQFFPFRAQGRDDLGARFAGRRAHFHPGETTGSKTRAGAWKAASSNLRKARFVQELLDVPNAEFAQANLENSRPRGVWKIRCHFLFGPDLSPARTVEAHLATSRYRAQSIHLDALCGRRGCGNFCRWLARKNPRRRRRSRTAQRHVGHGHLAHAGIADHVVDHEWICGRPSNR